MKKRVGVRCTRCDSLERTRALKVVLDHHELPGRDAKILHFGPEQGLSDWLSTVSPTGYDPVDFDPSRYTYANARKFDLTSDAASLPSDYYDLILHCHVLEHVPCNLAYILFHLSRALKPNGWHVFCVPLRAGSYDEYFGPLSAEMAIRRFGQWDHVRSFGVDDLDRHLGMIMALDLDYSLYKYCDAATLDRYNIPESHRSGLTASTIFMARKGDYRLQV